jgi:hypothetical protein
MITKLSQFASMHNFLVIYQYANVFHNLPVRTKFIDSKITKVLKIIIWKS